MKEKYGPAVNLSHVMDDEPRRMGSNPSSITALSLRNRTIVEKETKSAEQKKAQESTNNSALINNCGSMKHLAANRNEFGSGYELLMLFFTLLEVRSFVEA